MSLCVSRDGRWAGGGGAVGGGYLERRHYLGLILTRGWGAPTSIISGPPRLPRLLSRFTRSRDLGDTGRWASLKHDASVADGTESGPAFCKQQQQSREGEESEATYQLARSRRRWRDFNESGRQESAG